MKLKRWQWALVGLVLVAVAVAVWLLWREQLWQVFTDREALEAWIVSLGAWGPVVIVVANFLQVLLAPVPGQVVGIAAGYLYGVLWGSVLAMVGLILGTLVAVWLARMFGRPLVERVAGEETLRRLDGYVERSGSLALLLIYLIPFLPDDLICFVAGLTPLSLGRILLLAFIGRLPGVVASALIGSRARALSGLEIGILVGVSLVLVLLVALFQKRLEQAMFRLLDKLTGKD